MLTWKGDGSRTVRTWEVLAGPSPDGPFERVNGADLVSTAFLHARRGVERLAYRVRAVDYLGRKGPETESVTA
jgi:hypothetical protein